MVSNMKILDYIKRIFLIISSSSVINLILFIATIVSIALNYSNIIIYKITAVFFALEVMFLNANRYEGF